MSADRLAIAIAEFRLDDVPVAAIRHAKQIVRDTLGTLLAGTAEPENAAAAAAAGAIGGPGAATVAGSGVHTTPHVAAMVNATAAVTLELDEGNQFAVNHPSVHVLPAALAVGEDRRVTGAQVLEAFIAGYETAVTLGAATRLRDAVHPFGTTAVVGAAAAAARLHRLEPTDIAAVLRLAAGMTIASSQSAANSGASVRNLCTGLTAHNGVLAVTLHAAGFTGEPAAFERVFGHVLGRGDAPDWRWSEPDPVIDHDALHLTRNYFKLHACSRWNHAPIEAAAALMAEGSFDVADVDRVIVWTYDPAVRLAGSEPTNGYAAKHSIPFNVAARMLLGSNDLDIYTGDVVADPSVRRLARQVEVREDVALTRLLPDVRAARVEVVLADGRTLEARVDAAPGGFDNPYDERVLEAKFRRLAGRALSDEGVTGLLDACGRLDTLTGVSELTRWLVAPAATTPS